MVRVKKLARVHAAVNALRHVLAVALRRVLIHARVVIKLVSLNALIIA